MDLNVQKIKVNYNVMPKGLTYYIIGQPKTGKSTQASKWSDKGQNGVLVLDTDLGADFVQGANIVPIISLNQPLKEVKKGNESKFEVIPPEKRGYVYRNGPDIGKPMPVYAISEVLFWLEENFEKSEYDTIVIDTVDQVNEWIEDTVKEEMGISEMGMGGYGSDWAKARKKNADVVKRIQMLIKRTAGTLVLISHSKKTNIEDEKVQLGPSLPRGLGKALTAKSDVIGFTEIDKKSGDYLINFKAYDERSNGSRFKPIAQKILPFSYDAIKKEIKEYKEE